MNKTMNKDNFQQVRTTKARVIKTVIFALLLIMACGWSYTTLFGQFELPDCTQLLIGKSFVECHWEIEIDKDKEFIKIRLIVDGHEAGSVEVASLSIVGDPDFAGAPFERGWIGYINVNPAYQNLGLGTRLWKLGDQAILHTYGPGQVRIYTNASRNNPAFAGKIMQQVRTMFESPDGDFIYIIR